MAEEAFECTVSRGAAIKILGLMDIAYGESMLGDVDDIMLAIGTQYPDLVEEYSYLPWP
jgi:hypothetical protein